MKAAAGHGRGGKPSLLELLFPDPGQGFTNPSLGCLSLAPAGCRPAWKTWPSNKSSSGLTTMAPVIQVIRNSRPVWIWSSYPAAILSSRYLLSIRRCRSAICFESSVSQASHQRMAPKNYRQPRRKEVKHHRVSTERQDLICLALRILFSVVLRGFLRVSKKIPESPQRSHSGDGFLGHVREILIKEQPLAELLVKRTLVG